VSVVPTGQSGYQPPYNLLSCTQSNQDLTLTWQSVRNNRYRIQYTRDLSDPASWAFVQWSPKLDTNLYATGPTCMFKTNLACLFGYEPSVDVTKPLFFRIYSRAYEP
jgi:hypothetical protein